MSAREYVTITEQQMDRFFDHLCGDSYEKHVPEGAKEIAYDVPLPADDLVVRVWSSVHVESGSGRAKGKDAIRCVIWDTDAECTAGGREKTLRIQTWQKNLSDKVQDLMRNWRNHATECPACGARMALRDGEYGEFLGCTNYPECQETVQV